MKSKSALVISKIIEKIQLCVGWFLIIIFGMSTILTLVDRSGIKESIISTIFTGLGIWLIILSRKRKKLISDFRTYITMLSSDPTGSIENLALNLGTSQDVVINNLQQMIIKKYFVNAYIDSSNNRVVLAHAGVKKNTVPNAYSNIQTASNPNIDKKNEKEEEYISVTCKSCGGINKITKGEVGECEYCGSPIK
ncbi:hypothetical protein [Anaerosporobacter sp.]